MKSVIKDTDSTPIEFSGELWHWRGPAPFYFVTVPDEHCLTIKSVSTLVTYGWGMVPVRVWVGQTDWTTSLFPKEGRYLVPLKASVRQKEQLEEGQTVTLRLGIR